MLRQETSWPDRRSLCFGPFRLGIHERLLTRDGVEVEIGGRTLEVLIALIAKPGAIMSKDELIATAWPGVVVTQGSLRFQIALLRKILGDGVDRARYIANVAGRGYSFIAEVLHDAPSHDTSSQRAPPADSLPSESLPAALSELFGRADDVAAIAARLASHRFVTIAGTGGVGKTSVAVEVGHGCRRHGPVAFVDFASLSDPSLVPTAIATVLRLSVRSTDPTPALLAYLQHKDMLLVLDNCEHVIEVAAALAARIWQTAPQVRILATSREPLDVSGEYIFRLEPLANPPDRPDITVDMVQACSATCLFMARANASGAHVVLDAANARVVAGICRRLDGLALAIELAARRVVTYGLHQTAELLEQRLSLAWRGQRTALARQQTLRATLDWSFDLLDEREKTVLCQLPVFVGPFTLSAARSVVAAEPLDEEDVVEALASLAEKSLLAVDRSAMPVRFRLLESTRDYALSKSERQIPGLRRRHAGHARRHLEAIGAVGGAFSRDTAGASAIADMGNVRAALVWCFGPDGDLALGVGLAAAAVPAFLAMSLLAECHRWAERALDDLAREFRGSRAEMQLRAALGLSSMFTRGNTDEVRVALEESLALAQVLGDAPSQVQLLGSLQIFHERIGAFEVSLRHAERSAAVAANSADPTTISTANALVGLCRHLVGDQAGALALLQAAIAAPQSAVHSTTIYFGFDHRNRAGIALARTLWLQGQVVEATHTARRTVAQAEALGHPVTLCIALIWAVSIDLWAADLDSAEANIERFVDCASAHSLGPYLAVGRGFQSHVAIRRGRDPLDAVAVIRRSAQELKDARYELLSTDFLLALAEGLQAMGRDDEALVQIDSAIEDVRRNGDLFYLPELLRVRAMLLLRTDAARVDEVQACLRDSLDLARAQGALSWELRAATDLARLWASAEAWEPGRTLLGATIARFEEGLDTPDLLAAAALLRQLDELEEASQTGRVHRVGQTRP